MTMPTPDYWTERQLAEYVASIPTDCPDWPDWRRKMRLANRRYFCPTFAEARAHVRSHAASCWKPLKQCPVVGGVRQPVEGGLTASGVEGLTRTLRRLRREHTALIRAEREANR